MSKALDVIFDEVEDINRLVSIYVTNGWLNGADLDDLRAIKVILKRIAARHGDLDIGS